MDAPKKVPLGIRLKSTRPSYMRIWPEPNPPEARQNFYCRGFAKQAGAAGRCGSFTRSLCARLFALWLYLVIVNLVALLYYGELKIYKPAAHAVPVASARPDQIPTKAMNGQPIRTTRPRRAPGQRAHGGGCNWLPYFRRHLRWANSTSVLLGCFRGHPLGLALERWGAAPIAYTLAIGLVL